MQISAAHLAPTMQVDFLGGMKQQNESMSHHDKEIYCMNFQSFKSVNINLKTI